MRINTYGFIAGLLCTGLSTGLAGLGPSPLALASSDESTPQSTGSSLTIVANSDAEPAYRGSGR